MIFAIALISACLCLLSIWHFLTQLAKNQAGFLEFFVLGYGVMVLLDITAATVLRDGSFEYNRALQLEAVLWTYFSVFVMLITYFLTKRYFKPKPTTITVPKFNLKRFNRVVLPISLLFSFLYLISQLLSFQIPETISLLFVSYIRALSIILICVGIERQSVWKIILGFLLIFLFSSLIDTVSRRAFIVPFFVVCVYYFDVRNFKYKKSYSQNLRLATLFGFAIIVLGVSMRLTWFKEITSDASSFDIATNYLRNLTFIDTFRSTVRVLEIFPSGRDFVWFESYATALTNYIPREFWPDKPVNLGARLGYYHWSFDTGYDFFAWSERAYSASAGFVGEAYASFGYVGIFLVSVLVVLIAQLLDTKFKTNKLMLNRRFTINSLHIVIWMPAFLLLGRGSLFDATFFSLLSGSFCFVLLIFCRGRNVTIQNQGV